MAEFSVPFTLVTPAGNITFNGTGDGFYLTEVSALTAPICGSRLSLCLRRTLRSSVAASGQGKQ